MITLAACGSREAPAADSGVATSHCVAPEGTTPAPRTIEDVVTLLNALPMPVTLPCFIETLARPLKMHATRSLISAQPSVGPRSPRIFLFFEGLRLSIAPAGLGSRLLEFGEIRDDVRSLKAEIEFPVMAPLTPQAPFDRILYTATATACSFCHAAEQPAEDITFTTAFTNLSLRPSAGNGVSIEALAAERAACDPAAEPDRCAMLQSLYGQGTPVEQGFPTNLATLD